MTVLGYIKEIFLGSWGLLQGMYISMLNFWRPKVTEQYPENRGRHVYPAAFRGRLIMPHDERNFHKCTACGICEINCPNGTIKVTPRMEADPATGRERKVLESHVWDLGSCTFCALCTQTCPQDAIRWTNDFEHALFTREKLFHRLNMPGSSLAPKEPAATVDAKTE